MDQPQTPPGTDIMKPSATVPDLDPNGEATAAPPPPPPLTFSNWLAQNAAYLLIMLLIVVAIVVAGAEALRGLLQGGDSIERYCKQIFEREAEADEITRQVLTAVRRTFITPFDRTDIQDLISSMDDSIDQMNKTAKGARQSGLRNARPN